MTELPEGQLIGYARVSTEEQNLDMQTAALKKAGCVQVYEEQVSGAGKKRPQLDQAIANLEPGDTFVVWRLDRLARSMHDFYKRLDEIEKAGAKFRSLTESFDTGSIGGRFLLHILAAVAELERQLTRERTVAGLERAKARGAQIGAKKKMDAKKIRKLVTMALETNKAGRPKYNRAMIGKALKCHPGTVDLYTRPVGGLSGIRKCGDADKLVAKIEKLL